MACQGKKPISVKKTTQVVGVYVHRSTQVTREVLPMIDLVWRMVGSDGEDQSRGFIPWKSALN
jgi:hypothetical protein